MAAPSTSRTCLQCLRLSRPGYVLTPQTGVLRTQPQRSLHAPAPLHLNFLAPAWHPVSLGANSKRSTRAQPAPRVLQSRRFSSTPPARAKPITNPRKDDAGNDLTITITPRAAHRLQTIAVTDKNPDLALRVAVESGGCHGFQYLMSLTNVKDADSEEDTVFENEGVVGEGEDESGYRAKVIMDEPSLELLKGSSVDYTMELIGSQFKVTGIPGAKSSCGCGTSFDIAA